MDVIQHEGEVISADNKVVKVLILQKTACADCHAKSACSIADRKEKVFEFASSGLPFTCGDKVIIEGKSSMGLKAVFYAFILPLLFLFIIVIGAVQLHFSEAVAAVCGLSALALYYSFLYLFRKRLEGKFVFEIKQKDR
ncbi:SoxR reducing system RseC family protein [Bacteroidales bacterium OttesenSCG-928-I14]|nr:SoxR reducing system RseC family protein [Bacteroidales bacterium OttesenSCG-928-I14]